MSGELVDKGIDEAERDDAPNGRRRGLLWAGLGATVAVVAAGSLIVTEPWSNDDSSSTPAASTVPRPTSDTSPEPTLSSHLIIGDVPEGFVVQWLNDNEVNGPGVDDGSAMSTNVLLTAKGATIEDGPWLSATVMLLDRFERKSFDPDVYTSSGDGVAVTINGLKGSYVAKDFNDMSQLVYGPVKEGYAVTLSSKGLSRADLTSIATELDLDEAPQDAIAWPLFGATVDTLDLQTLTSYAQPFNGFGGSPEALAFGGFGGEGTSVNYGTDTESAVVTNAVPAAGMDVLMLARFGLSKSKDVTVHELPAVMGEIAGGFGMTVVIWLEGGRVITVAGSEGTNVLDMAQSVRVADDSEWSDLNDLANQNNGGPGDIQPTWLIAAGDLDDSTTWTIEGDVDDNGSFTLCSSSTTIDSSSNSGCSSQSKVEEASILDAGSLGVGGSTAEGYAALVPTGVEGAVLRFTSTDGVVTDVPLKVIRDDWGFQAAGFAVTVDGELSIVAADGSVLASLTVAAPEQGTDGSGTTAAGPIAVGGPDTTSAAPAPTPTTVRATPTETTAATG